MIGLDLLNTSMVCQQCTVNQFTSGRHIAHRYNNGWMSYSYECRVSRLIVQGLMFPF